MLDLNSVNLIQTDGGVKVKQGDSSSVFTFKLVDETNTPIETLKGKQAKITLATIDGIVYETESPVSDDVTVSFTISKVLRPREYMLEITCEGYVFPSDRKTIIEVVRSSDNYVYETSLERSVTNSQLDAAVQSLRGEITQNLSMLQTGGVDLTRVNESIDSLASRVTVLENAEDTSGQQNLDTEISQVKQSLDTITEQLQGRISEIESRVADSVTINQLTSAKANIVELSDKVELLAGLQHRVSILESKPEPTVKLPDNLVRTNDLATVQDKLQKLESDVALKVQDFDTRISSLESKPEPLQYDDSEIRHRLDVLETHPASDGQPTVVQYDDSNLKARLTANEQTITELGTRTLDNKQDIDSIDSRVTVLENKPTVPDLTSSVDDLDTRVQALENKPEVQPYNDTDIKNRVTSVEQANVKLNQNVEENGESIKSLTSRVSDIESKPTPATQEGLTSLTNRVNTLESQPVVPDLSESVNGLTTRVQALEDKPQVKAYDDTSIKQSIEQVKNDYALKSELPNLDSYATTEQLSDVVRESELAQYAKKVDIPQVPNLDGFETKTHASSTYATKEEIPVIPDLSNYATVASLSDVVRASTLDDYMTKENSNEFLQQVSQFVTGMVSRSELSSYAKKTDLPDMSQYAITSKINAANNLIYAQKTDLNTLTQRVTKLEQGSDGGNSTVETASVRLPYMSSAVQLVKMGNVVILNGIVEASTSQFTSGSRMSTNIPSGFLPASSRAAVIQVVTSGEYNFYWNLDSSGTATFYGSVSNGDRCSIQGFWFTK